MKKIPKEIIEAYKENKVKAYAKYLDKIGKNLSFEDFCQILEYELG
jgi:hypothetical protein